MLTTEEGEAALSNPPWFSPPFRWAPEARTLDFVIIGFCICEAVVLNSAYHPVSPRETDAEHLRGLVCVDKRKQLMQKAHTVT